MPFFKYSNGEWRQTVDVGLTQLGDTGSKPLFRVLTSFGYVSRRALLRSGGTIEPPANRRVQENDETDLASVPPFLWGVIASYGNHTMPALLHDRLCKDASGRSRALALAERREADDEFRTMLRDEADMGMVTRWIMWAAVRLFGVIPIGVLAIAACVLSAILPFVDGPLERRFETALIVTAAVLLICMVWASLEAVAAGGRRLRLPSLAAWAAAALIGGVALLPLLPVIGVTIATRAALWLADLMMFTLYFLLIEVPWWIWRSLTYPRVDPTLDTASGDDLGQPLPAATRRPVRATAEPVPSLGRIFPRL